MLNVIMLNVIMLNVVMLNVIMLNVIMLNGSLEPKIYFQNHLKFWLFVDEPRHDTVRKEKMVKKLEKLFFVFLIFFASSCDAQTCQFLPTFDLSLAELFVRVSML